MLNSIGIIVVVSAIAILLVAFLLMKLEEYDARNVKNQKNIQNEKRMLIEKLKKHTKIVNTYRQEYVNQIYDIIQQHENTLHAKFLQLVTEDDYGYIHYENYINELYNFAKNVILTRELSIYETPYYDEALQNNYEKLFSNIPDHSLEIYLYPVFEADFFNFCIFWATDDNSDIKIDNHSFGIIEDVYFNMLDKTDDIRSQLIFISTQSYAKKNIILKNNRLEEYRYLNACNVVEELVFSLYVNKWEMSDINLKQKNITPLDYEKSITIKLKSLGFNARTTKASGDQGADVIAKKNGVSFAIQCKKYSKPVGNKAVQEANAGRDFYNCDYGVVVSNAGFTKSARQAANACKIILLNDTQLDKLLQYST